MNTRPLSVSQLKGTRSTRKHQRVPREGTYLREIYDTLLAGGTVWVSERDPRRGTFTGYIHTTLPLFYGLELEFLGYGKGYRLKGTWDKI